MRAESTMELGGLTTMVVEHSGSPGPTVVITAGVHGDEVSGVAAARDVDQWLARRKRLVGRVVLFRCLNPGGLRLGRRAFESGQDLNRAFPGKRRGTAATRVAWTIWQALSALKPAAVIDLHTDSPASVPYVLVDRAVCVKGTERRELEQRATDLARATGLFWLEEYPDSEYRRFQLERSLAGAVMNTLRVPSITVEAGPKGVVCPTAVSRVSEAVSRCLAQLEMVSASSVASGTAQPNGYVRAHAPRPRTEGLFVPCIEPGVDFQGGDVLGHVVPLDSSKDESIVAEFDGRVVSWAPGAWVRPGMTLGTLARQVVS